MLEINLPPLPGWPKFLTIDLFTHAIDTQPALEALTPSGGAEDTVAILVENAEGALCGTISANKRARSILALNPGRYGAARWSTSWCLSTRRFDLMKELVQGHRLMGDVPITPLPLSSVYTKPSPPHEQRRKALMAPIETPRSVGSNSRRLFLVQKLKKAAYSSSIAILKSSTSPTKSPARTQKMPKKTKKSPKLEVPIGFLTVDYRWKDACVSVPPAIPHADSAFDAARAIYDGNVYVRFGLEARVLAVQSTEEIASKTLISSEVVAAYEHWFFAVREHLDVSGWITREAVRRRPTGALERDDVGAFWRWVGYQFGPIALDQLLASVHQETLRIKGIDAYVVPSVPLHPAFKLLIAIERMPTPATPKEWDTLRRYQRALALAQLPTGGELLTPLAIEFLPSREPDVACPVIDTKSIENGFEQLCELLNDFTSKTEEIVQSEKVSYKEAHCGLGV